MTAAADAEHAEPDGEHAELTALDMARNCARSVLRQAEFSQRDRLGAYVARAGDHGHVAAQLAANLALVSIAEDLHRIVAVMLGQAEGHVRDDEP